MKRKTVNYPFAIQLNGHRGAVYFIDEINTWFDWAQYYQRASLNSYGSKVMVF